MRDAPAPPGPGWRQVDATPYPWPFDGRWSAGDTVLLLLGLQRGPVAALGAAAACAAALAAAGRARAMGIAVIATRRGAGPDAPALVARRRDPADAPPLTGSDGWALAPGIEATASWPVVDHAGDNALIGTGLAVDLRAAGIRNLILAGVPTEGLVHATQRAANDAGLECLLLADACHGTTPAWHEDQLRITTFGNGLFGTVARLADLDRALSGQGVA